jgi:hypothetical protein
VSKTVIVWTCAHADPSVPNDRFTWLGNLIYDIRPDYCVDLGDGADMRSLNSFDSGKPSNVVSQNYEKDIESYNDAQERIRWKIRKNKVKMPAFYGFEGNHEHRIKKAIEHDPRLKGDKYGISFNHLDTSRWFNEYHEYSNGAPDIHPYDGVSYAHFIASGNYGTAMAGEHHAYNLLKKRFRSTTVGHSHKLDVNFQEGPRAIGLVAGCFKGADETWAGQANDSWSPGVVIKRGVEDGWYDFQWISLEQLEREYNDSRT